MPTRSSWTITRASITILEELKNAFLTIRWAIDYLLKTFSEPKLDFDNILIQRYNTFLFRIDLNLFFMKGLTIQPNFWNFQST